MNILTKFFIGIGWGLLVLIASLILSLIVALVMFLIDELINISCPVLFLIVVIACGSLALCVL